MMTVLKKTLTTLAIAAVFILPSAAAEMYYNRLSAGEEIVPTGTYGDIVVPGGGYKATQFPSTLGTISQATGDYGGSYAGIIIGMAGTKIDLADHTVSGWFKVPAKASGETTLCIEKTSASATVTMHRGNAIKVSADGHLLVGKIDKNDNWQDDSPYITSTDVIPLNQWFYLTVSFAVNTTDRTATAKAYVNGSEIAMPTTAFRCDYAQGVSIASCAAIKVGDNVECAGFRVDDAVIYDAATMKAWAVDPKYVVQLPSKESVWTGGAGDGDPTKAGNWKDGKIPDAGMLVKIGGSVALTTTSEKSFVCKVIEFTDTVTLTGDCDWSYLPNVPITADDHAVDVNGHNLTLTKVFTGTITDSTSGTSGSLTMSVGENETIENTTLSIQGNLKLVKGGAGTFVATKPGQTYTGGTVLAAGTVKTGIKGTDGPYGDGSTTNPKPITVESGATFDLNNKLDHTVYRFILNGGILTNTGGDMSQSAGFGSLTLGADSSLIAERSTSGWCGHTIDLGGHTLTVTIGDAKRLYLSGDGSGEPVTYTAGKIVVSSGGSLDFYKGRVNAKDVDFDISAALVVEVETDVHDYTARYNKNYNYGMAALNVFGTFKPLTAYWYGCTMQDGSTIDLSNLTGSWSVTSAFTGESRKTVSFADGALVWVNLGTRTDLKKNDKVISWTTKPKALFKVIPETMGVVVKNDGLYLAIEEGVPVVDPSGKGTVTIPMDWVMQHATGETPAEQYASLTADRTGVGNGVTLRDCYVLGLNPEDPKSVPYMAPTQISSAGKIWLIVQGLDVKAESGALVKYQMMTKTTGDYDKSGDPVYEPALETTLPTSGVKFYKVDVIVTTPEAGKAQTGL